MPHYRLHIQETLDTRIPCSLTLTDQVHDDLLILAADDTADTNTLSIQAPVSLASYSDLVLSAHYASEPRRVDIPVIGLESVDRLAENRLLPPEFSEIEGEALMRFALDLLNAAQPTHCTLPSEYWPMQIPVPALAMDLVTCACAA